MLSQATLANALWRQHVDGVIPGAVLAFGLLWSAFCWPSRLNEPLDWQRLGILIGASSRALLVGAKERKFLDIPLDSRIVVAVSIGFFLRGVAHLTSGLIR